MTPEPSLISPIGYSASSCGYCSPSGERSKDKSSVSYGFWATQMSVEMYESLMNRGWRRSGSYVYHPDMARTCCPQYTIRLKADAFRAGKRQRRVLSKFTRYILTGSQDFGAGEPHSALTKGRPGRGRQNKPFDLLERLRVPEAYQPVAASSASTPSSSRSPRPHSYKVTLQPSSPPHPALHPLYLKYQTLIHHDKPPTSLSASFESFSRFLCSSPLSDPTVVYTHPSLVSFAEGSDARKRKLEEMGLPDHYGSWHQIYWVDNEPVAFGVLDVVRGGVSSVYFVYDPTSGGGELGGMGWGKVTLSALREIGLVKAMAEAGAQGMKHLYMGYYIQSCQKMRYKAEFRPSFLLDPATNLFHPLDSLIPHLEAHRSGYFPFDNPPPLPTASNASNTSTIAVEPSATPEDSDQSMKWVDEDEGSDDEEETRKLPTSPPPPSFLDTRSVSKAVLDEVPTYLPGRGYINFASSPHARSKENVASLKELIAALHGPGPLGGEDKAGKTGVLSGDRERSEAVGLILVAL